MFKTCQQHWPADRVGPLITWPEGTMECQGSGGVTDCITSTRGAIGYLDAGHGQAEGLPEIELENADGTVQTSAKAAERDGIASALDAAQDILPQRADDDWSKVSLINLPGQYTWPIVLLTYVYVREDLTYFDDPEEQTLLKAFLQALYLPEYIQQCVEDHGFTLPTDSMKNFALAAIEGLRTVEGAEKWEFEFDTTPILAQGDFYISTKRRTHNEVERDVIFSAVEELQTRTAELELLLTESQTTLARVEEDTFDKDAMLTTAMVLSVLSFVMSLAILACSFNRLSHKPTMEA